MTYCYPYKQGTGWRSQAFRSNPNQGANGPGGHTGFDEAMDAGTPLYAPADGIVRNSSWVSENYLENPWWLTQMGGDILVLDCFGPDGTTATGPAFILAHLSDSIADVGQRVSKGELIALSGNSGTATTGPHCHIEALPPNWDFNNGVYGRVDPETYFDEWPDDYVGSQGIAAQAGIITPLSEEDDMNEEQERKLDSLVAWVGKLIDNSATKTDLDTAVEKVPAKVWSYTNPALGNKDAYQILRDAVAGTDKVAAMVAAVAAREATNGATEAQITDAVIKALHDSTVKVDVTVNGGQ